MIITTYTRHSSMTCVSVLNSECYQKFTYSSHTILIESLPHSVMNLASKKMIKLKTNTQINSYPNKFMIVEWLPHCNVARASKKKMIN